MDTHFFAQHSGHRLQTPRQTMLAGIVAVTVGAAALAWLLASVTSLSEQAIVVVVMVVAFAASWMNSGRRSTGHHRATYVHARVHTRAPLRP